MTADPARCQLVRTISNVAPDSAVRAYICDRPAAAYFHTEDRKGGRRTVYVCAECTASDTLSSGLHLSAL